MTVVSPVYRIGRFEVAGYLATGGMAEILLGRVVGPAGFERPVVLKRILPHLAREKAFVDMFLDEARVAALVRHPNVVQVHELLHEEDELCIVMEYLEGESVATVMRRLHLRGRHLPPALCAHVIAEVAGGLHAAHELSDDEGRRLELVHRDVSPQNVFIGYDGSVKVLDFGIAVVRDRSTKTETGHIRGKFEYMSPEQCAAKALDRRSDLFSLGIVLFELSTGTRLFKRKNQLQVMRAIVDDPVPAPPSLVEGYPAALAEVVLRALERDCDDRYQTAADMRRDLIRVGRSLGDGELPEEALAALMGELFEERKLEKAEMLRRLRSGSDLSKAPRAEADETVELPVATDVATGVERPAALSASRPMIRQQARRRVRVGLALGAGSMASLAIILLVGLLAFGERSGPATVAPPTSATLPSAPPVLAASSAWSDPARRAVAPVQVVIHVESKPSGAAVLFGGKPAGHTPVDLTVDRGSEPVEVELRRTGYQPLRERVVPSVDQRLRLVLLPRPARPRPKPSAEPYRRFK